MHCPDCGTLNEAQPRYCRKCGRSLAGVQLALDGRVDEAITRFKTSEDLLGLGLLVFAITMLGAFFMLFLEGPRAFSFIVILAVLVSLPIVLTGLIKIDRVRRLLETSEVDPKQINRAEI